MLERPTENPSFGLYLQRRDVEVILGYDDFLGELEEIMVLPLKDRRRYLKNDIFRVSIMLPLSLT